jgi:hypothetical protein
MQPHDLHLLQDEDIHRFITDGYMAVQAGLPAAFHEAVCRKIDTVLEEEGNPGNNILPRIPEIQQVFDQPAVQGAMTSLLGPGYLIHPHRYCHLNKPGGSGQSWHKDDYIFDQNVRHARFRWVMAFYYPQDVTEDMGPTGILPGRPWYNHISDADAARSTEEAISLCGPAGTVSIVNFDTWHRATANVSDKNRYMLKFQFTRMEEPKEPTWHQVNPSWSPAAGDATPAVSESVWRWLAGDRQPKTSPCTEPIDHWLAGLDHVEEATRLQAAYMLGRFGVPAVDPLLERLRRMDEEILLANTAKTAANPAGGNPSELPAAYGLSAIGLPATEKLIQALDDPAWWVRATAADVLGDINAPPAAALPALLRLLSDENVWVRRNAADALSIIGGFPTDSGPVLCEALTDEDERVRRNIVFALSKQALRSDELVTALVRTIHEDEGRYVRYYALAALKKMATSAAHDALWNEMLTSRWCPVTHKKSAF